MSGVQRIGFGLAAIVVLTVVTGGFRQRPATADDPVPAVIQDFAFQPETLTVAPGTSVQWINQDTAPHTVTSGQPRAADAGAAFDSGLLNAGDAFSFTFVDEGTYDFFCLYHPYMRGTVVVQQPGDGL